MSSLIMGNNFNCILKEIKTVPDFVKLSFISGNPSEAFYGLLRPKEMSYLSFNLNVCLSVRE